MKYKILEEDSSSELEESVNNFLDKGWVPYGPLIVTPETRWHNIKYTQTLYKTDDG